MTSFWIALWQGLLVGSLAMFALLAVLVTVGGARDVARLLRRLGEKDSTTEIQ